MIKLIAKFAADETGAVTVDVRAGEIDEELTDYAISTSF